MGRFVRIVIKGLEGETGEKVGFERNQDYEL